MTNFPTSCEAAAVLWGPHPRATAPRGPRRVNPIPPQRPFVSSSTEVPGELDAGLSDEVLAAAARLICRYHDATAASVLAEQEEVICHNDLSRCNFVFRGGVPAGIIDFDNAAPGKRLHDVGYALFLWLNLGNRRPLTRRAGSADQGLLRRLRNGRRRPRRLSDPRGGRHEHQAPQARRPSRRVVAGAAHLARRASRPSRSEPLTEDTPETRHDGGGGGAARAAHHRLRQRRRPSRPPQADTRSSRNHTYRAPGPQLSGGGRAHDRTRRQWRLAEGVRRTAQPGDPSDLGGRSSLGTLAKLSALWYSRARTYRQATATPGGTRVGVFGSHSLTWASSRRSGRAPRRLRSGWRRWACGRRGRCAGDIDRQRRGIRPDLRPPRAMSPSPSGSRLRWPAREPRTRRGSVPSRSGSRGGRRRWPITCSRCRARSRAGR
jgi:hypothetical protein